MNDRLFDLWSQDIKQARLCNRLLNEFRPENGASHAENWLSKLIKQSMESGNIKEIFKGSIHNSLRILQIDTDNCTDIKGLERPEYKEIFLNHLATVREVDAKKFVDAMKEAQSRMQGVNIEHEVMKLFQDMRLKLDDREDERNNE